MIEPISIAVTVLTLIERTVTIGQKVLSYYNALVEAPATSLAMRKEFTLILQFLQNIKITSPSDEMKEYMRLLAEGFDDIWLELEPRISEEKTKTWGGRVVWVFTIEETERLVRKVERIKSSYALVLGALNYDVSMRIYDNTEKIKLLAEMHDHDLRKSQSSVSCRCNLLFHNPDGSEDTLAMAASPMDIEYRRHSHSPSSHEGLRPTPTRTDTDDTNLSGTTFTLNTNPSRTSLDTASLFSFSTQITSSKPSAPPTPLLEYQPHIYAMTELRIAIKKKQQLKWTSIPGVNKTALSPSGKLAALFTDNAIYVFETSTQRLVWQGQVEKTSYKYTLADGQATKEVKFKTPASGGLANFKETPSFTAVGMTDNYLVVSTQGKTLIFATTGQRSGELVMYDAHEAIVDKFVFSPDNGHRLLGLMRKGGSKTAQARIYNVALFPPLHSEKAMSLVGKGVSKMSSEMYSEVPLPYETTLPRGAAFSSSGNLLAIYSNANANGMSTLWILQNYSMPKDSWTKAVQQEIRVLSADAKNRGTGTHIGITGLAFFGADQFLQLSLQTNLKKAIDCYRLNTQLIPTTDNPTITLEACKSSRFPEVSRILSSGIAMSHEFNAAVFLDTGGELHYQQFRQRRGDKSKVKLEGGIQRAVNAACMVFAGEKFYSLDTEGKLHVHSFRKEMNLVLPMIGIEEKSML